MPTHLGELAAIGTSICYSFGSVIFTFVGRELGASLTNRTRLGIALIFVLIIHLLTFGQLLPANATPQTWFWLALSGLIGFVFGDFCLFQAFILIGPRLAMLVFSFAPALSVLFAWLLLGEALAPEDLIVIAVILGGIAWVVSERPANTGDTPVQPDDRRKYLIGVLFGVLAAVGQAGGYVLSKIGLANDFPAFSATLIRLLVAAAFVWLLTTVQGHLPSSLRTLRQHPRDVGWMSVAAFLGPVVGVWLSLVAVQNTSVGIASTLSSLMPIFLLPISYVVFHEKITRRAIVGTVIVIVATAFLFL